MALALAATIGAIAPARALDVRVHYLEQTPERPPTLATLDAPPVDEGLAGARLGLSDNAAGGRFLGHDWSLEEVVTSEAGAFLEAAFAALREGARLLVVNAPADSLTALADMPEADEALILNAGSPDDSLRLAQCRANVLHTLPSRAMLADGLAQFMALRRWTDWTLVRGEGPGDGAFAESLRRAARKFGARIVEEKTWAFDADMRRSAVTEAPLFMQGRDHDVVMVADEIGDWARYVLYNQQRPRPVAGSEGLRPGAWSSMNENWGAGQLQSRFEALAGRPMRDVDWAAWAAVRSLGEAVTRTRSTDPSALRAYMLSGDFELGGFKGHALTFRDWNGQLRQPVILSHPRALAAVAPVEGFLHERSELDTLGYDKPESPCEAFE
jgi:ABC transporter substrate binding protein (PQQ-dependent alcohol dehydrogenase system)